MSIKSFIAKVYHLEKGILIKDPEITRMLIKHLITLILISISGGYIIFLFISQFYYLNSFNSSIVGWVVGFILFLLQNAIGYNRSKLVQIVGLVIWTNISLLLSLLLLSAVFSDDIKAIHYSEGYLERISLGQIITNLREVLHRSNLNLFFAFTFFFVFEGFYFLYVSIMEQVSTRSELRAIKVESKRSVESLFNNQAKALSYVQHELGNKLPAVQNDFSYLKRVLIDYSSSEFNLKTKVREPLANEDPSTIDCINDILNRIDQGLNYSIHSLKNASSIISTNQAEMQLEEVFLLEFLRNLSRAQSGLNKFQSIFTGDEKAVVKLDRAQFSSIINNLVSNALEHGFKDSNINNKIVYNVKNKKDNVELIIKNNGNAFPENFTIEDYLMPHRYSGTSGKTGMGGYFIGIILRKHNATISLLPYEQEEDFKVKLLITFEKEF